MTKTVQLSERQYSQLQDSLLALEALCRILKEGGSPSYIQTAALLRPVVIRLAAPVRELESKFKS